MTPKELRQHFRGTQSKEEALAALRAFGDDRDHHPGHRMEAASAMLDLRTGRSVQSAMARFRRAVGIDPPKASR